MKFYSKVFLLCVISSTVGVYCSQEQNIKYDSIPRGDSTPLFMGESNASLTDDQSPVPKALVSNASNKDLQGNFRDGSLSRSPFEKGSSRVAVSPNHAQEMQDFLQENAHQVQEFEDAQNRSLLEDGQDTVDESQSVLALGEYRTEEEYAKNLEELDELIRIEEIKKKILDSKKSLRPFKAELYQDDVDEVLEDAYKASDVNVIMMLSHEGFLKDVSNDTLVYVINHAKDLNIVKVLLSEFVSRGITSQKIINKHNQITVDKMLKDMIDEAAKADDSDDDIEID